MVQGKNIMKIDMVRVKYTPQALQTDNFFVASKFIDTLCVTMNDLKRDIARRAAKRYTMTPRDYSTYMWRTRILIAELQEMGPDAKLRLVEWSIQTDNESFFHLEGDEYATDVCKLITPCRSYWCKETPKSVVSGIDIFQEEVGGENGGPTWMEDMKPFYHSMERCSILHSPCIDKLSCSKTSSMSPTTKAAAIRRALAPCRRSINGQTMFPFLKPSQLQLADPYLGMPPLGYSHSVSN